MNKYMFKKLTGQQFFTYGNTNYIWLPEMEWLDENEAMERKEIWSDTFELQELELFAVDGYGDMYAWFKGGNFNEEVVFIDLESELGGEFFAPDLAAAIFRRILEFASGTYKEFCTNDEKSSKADREDHISEFEALKILKNCRYAFGDHFKDNWNEMLDKMIECGFNDQNCFISDDRVTLLELAHLLSYPKIGKPIALRK